MSSLVSHTEASIRSRTQHHAGQRRSRTPVIIAEQGTWVHHSSRNRRRKKKTPAVTQGESAQKEMEPWAQTTSGIEHAVGSLIDRHQKPFADDHVEPLTGIVGAAGNSAHKRELEQPIYPSQPGCQAQMQGRPGSGSRTTRTIA